MEFKYFIFITPSGVYALTFTFSVFLSLTVIFFPYFKTFTNRKKELKVAFFSQIGLNILAFILIVSINDS